MAYSTSSLARLGYTVTAPSGKHRWDTDPGVSYSSLVDPSCCGVKVWVRCAMVARAPVVIQI